MLKKDMNVDMRSLASPDSNANIQIHVHVLPKMANKEMNIERGKEC